jgi:hypothetical protein
VKLEHYLLSPAVDTCIQHCYHYIKKRNEGKNGCLMIMILGDETMNDLMQHYENKLTMRTVFNSKLNATWYEYNGTAYQIRVAVRQKI